MSLPVQPGRAVRRAGLAAIIILLITFIASFGVNQFLVTVGRTDHPIVWTEIASRRVALWKPTGPAPSIGYPIILFSHGFLVCGTQSVFLTESLAEAGYLVLAP